MGTVWLKNFLGLKQTEFELLKVPNRRLEYGIHITLRTAEIGTIMGSIFGPLLTLLMDSGKSSDARIKQAFTQGGLTGAFFGAAIGSLISFYRSRGINKLVLYDHCYRLRFDNADLNLDRACFLGATLGLLGCGGYGYVVGVDAAFLMSYLFSKKQKLNL